MATANNIFAFIVHPLNVENFLYIFENSIFLHRIPRLYLKKIIPLLPPLLFVRIKDIKSPAGLKVDGLFILCTLLPEHFATLNKDFVLRKIIKCVQFAEKLGARVVTLGGFTSIFSNQGCSVVSQTNIAVTTGNTFTSYLVYSGILKAINTLEYDLSQLTILVVGATGDIGSACVRSLGPNCKRLMLVARDKLKLDDFANNLGINKRVDIRVVNELEDVIGDADIVITATSSMTTLIDVNSLKSGSIVCDVSLPPNIARNILSLRKDVLVFEGGYARLSSFESIDNRDFKKHFIHGSVFGCLSEGIILAMEEKFESFSLGRGQADLLKMRIIGDLGEKHGLTLAPFFCGEKVYVDEDFNFIRKSSGRLH